MSSQLTLIGIRNFLTDIILSFVLFYLMEDSNKPFSSSEFIKEVNSIDVFNAIISTLLISYLLKLDRHGTIYLLVLGGSLQYIIPWEIGTDVSTILLSVCTFQVILFRFNMGKRVTIYFGAFLILIITKGIIEDAFSILLGVIISLSLAYIISLKVLRLHRSLKIIIISICIWLIFLILLINDFVIGSESPDFYKTTFFVSVNAPLFLYVINKQKITIYTILLFNIILIMQSIDIGSLVLANLILINMFLRFVNKNLIILSIQFASVLGYLLSAFPEKVQSYDFIIFVILLAIVSMNSKLNIKLLSSYFFINKSIIELNESDSYDITKVDFNFYTGKAQYNFHINNADFHYFCLGWYFNNNPNYIVKEDYVQSRLGKGGWIRPALSCLSVLSKSCIPLTPFVDNDFYQRKYKDTSVDPAIDYFLTGWAKGKNPREDIDTSLIVLQLYSLKPRNPIIEFIKNFSESETIRFLTRRSQESNTNFFPYD